MSNVFDYLKWRDDIELDEINDIDALIFSRLVYFPLEFIMDKNESLTINELYNRSLKLNDIKYARVDDEKLFSTIAKSVRYKDLKVSNLVNVLDEAIEEQFMAISINLSHNYLFVAYRGTTINLIGWKENFNMAYLDSTPAQLDSVKYINNIGGFNKIYIGGHSKGGNLAMYAGIDASKKIKSRIIKIYNFDGPGFMSLDDNYNEMKDKIMTFLPGSSVVGRLLKLDTKTTIVKSNARGIMQHDLYSWELENKYFINDTLSDESNKIKNIIEQWISKMDRECMKEFVNKMYDIIKSTGAVTTKDLNIMDLKNVIVSYKNMDEESKKLLISVLGYLFNSTKQNIKLDI